MKRARRNWKAIGFVLLSCVLLGAAVASIANGAASNDRISFEMIRSAGLEGTGCVPNAGAEVIDQSSGPVETLTVNVHGLPANTDFDFFVIQVPNGPFGLAWYQGDIETGPDGSGHGVFVGRFSIETFIVAPGSAPRSRGSRPAAVPGCELESGHRTGSHLPPGTLVQRLSRRRQGRLPGGSDAVQRRAQRRRPGTEHPAVPERRRAVADARTLSGPRMDVVGPGDNPGGSHPDGDVWRVGACRGGTGPNEQLENSGPLYAMTADGTMSLSRGFRGGSAWFG